jgi:hypothetical protein
LRDLDAVREPCAKQITLVINEHLRLVLKATKSGAMNDAVAVTLKFTASIRSAFREMTST